MIATLGQLVQECIAMVPRPQLKVAQHSTAQHNYLVFKYHKRKGTMHFVPNIQWDFAVQFLDQVLMLLQVGRDRPNRWCSGRFTTQTQK